MKGFNVIPQATGVSTTISAHDPLDAALRLLDQTPFGQAEELCRHGFVVEPHYQATAEECTGVIFEFNGSLSVEAVNYSEGMCLDSPPAKPHLHQHGACDAADAQPLVRDQLDDIPDGVRADLLDRLKYGERKKYGQPLRVGWERATVAGYQEALDGLAYAIAGEDHEGVALWVSMCIRQRARLGGGES